MSMLERVINGSLEHARLLEFLRFERWKSGAKDLSVSTIEHYAARVLWGDFLLEEEIDAERRNIRPNGRGDESQVLQEKPNSDRTREHEKERKRMHDGRITLLFCHLQDLSDEPIFCADEVFEDVNSELDRIFRNTHIVPAPAGFFLSTQGDL